MEKPLRTSNSYPSTSNEKKSTVATFNDSNIEKVNFLKEYATDESSFEIRK